MGRLTGQTLHQRAVHLTPRPLRAVHGESDHARDGLVHFRCAETAPNGNDERFVLRDAERAARGENITVIFVNNAIYGMTGGQMAPTSLPGQITQTSPYGRDVNTCGWPIRICEMLATLEAPAYLERVTVNNVKNVKNAKKAIEKAFRYQVEGKGFSLIEVLSACPTNWGLTPQKALEWIDEKMIPYYPLGVYRDKEG
jgi:2-oxoglutarate ferredoxin oxidoreductase subunit beta